MTLKMKKTISLFIALAGMLCPVSGVYAQKATIACEKSVHNFGTICESDGKVSHSFVIKNEGDAPLVLTNVTASCGCTVPAWSKQPIPAGKTGTVKITYDPAGRPGTFVKSLSVYSNGMKGIFRLSIRGKVDPKNKKDKE